MNEERTPLADHYASHELGENIDAETLVAIIESRELPKDVLEKIAKILDPYAERASTPGHNIDNGDEEPKDDDPDHKIQ